jgi:DNA-binding MarR family transcriptional regulator
MRSPVESKEPAARAEDQLLAEAARLRALPSFVDAVRAYTVGLGQLREAPRLINKLISYEKRFRVVGYLLYLHADREKFGPRGGATYGRLLELCTRRQEASPRVVKTVLGLLKLSGMIKTSRDQADGRVKYYVPTARMDGFIEQWLTYAVNALDALQPDGRRMEMLRSDPGFAERFLVSGGRDHIDNEPPADRMPEFIGFFGACEGAAAVILAVMMADFGGAPLPSQAQIAKRFGLSKSQVSNVIAEGAKLGFFTLDAATAPSATPYLRDSYGSWISIELAFYARHMAPA